MAHGITQRQGKAHPWLTISGTFGAVLLGSVGIVFGSVGAGIEPDGQFIPCGPPVFGRNDSQWDPRCVAAEGGVRTFAICLLSLAAVLLTVAVLSAINSRRVRQ